MKNIRSTLILSLLSGLLLSLPAVAQRDGDAGRASKNGKTEGTIDGVEITVEFGRPNVKERKLWGALVPHGKVWRTGADEATTISFGKAVKIEGEALAAGKYSLFTIPGDSEWVVIFNKNASQWGAFGYSDGDDALRVKVKPGSSAHEESMNFEIDGSKVVLRWGEVAVGFSVSAG